MSVTIVSCLYGTGYERFTAEWDHATRQLDPRPDSVLVTSDRSHEIPGALVFTLPRCGWRHRQAFYLQHAIELARTDWVWILDIDDLAMPDALDGLEDVQADVWLMGYESHDETYIPDALPNDDYLAATGNAYPAGCAVRAEAFKRAGGFPDVAFQDWALWRRLAHAGATFDASGRTHYRYRRHEDTRSAVELTRDRRAEHLAEMLESEAVLVG